MPKKKKKKKKEEEAEDLKTKDKEKDKDKKKEEKWEEITRRRITVDFWRTSLHGEKIGIHQKDQQRARSRHFTKDMELYGEIKDGDTEMGHIGFKTNDWLETDTSKGELPRLIVRLFNETGRWLGSIEENTILSLMLSTLYRENTPVFDIILHGNPNVYRLLTLEKAAGSDECAVPIIFDKKSKIVEFLVFDRRRLTLGDDWRVYLASNRDRTVADIDSKKLNIGGLAEINIYDPELDDNSVFVRCLILFTSLIKFWDDVKKTLEKAYKSYENDEFRFQPNRYELDLMENPRGKGR